MVFNSFLLSNENEVLNYRERDLQPLLDLIPKIRETKDFQGSPLIQEFQKYSYETKIMIDYEWSNWERGSKIIENPNFNYKELDLISTCKLITALVHSEICTKNGLVDFFEEGIVLSLLESLEQNVHNS